MKLGTAYTMVRGYGKRQRATGRDYGDQMRTVSNLLAQSMRKGGATGSQINEATEALAGMAEREFGVDLSVQGRLRF